MPDSDRIPPRPVHRFVPTLTEVVQPEMPEALAPAPVAMAPAGFTPEMLEALVDAAVRKVEPVLGQKLPELLAVMLHEQALAISERLRREIQTVVRESLTATLGSLQAAGKLSASSAPEESPPWRAGHSDSNS